LSKKPVLKNHISYGILSQIGFLTSPYEICKKHNISKQRANYWLKKFKKEGWITSPFHAYYEITDSGKTILDTYEQQFNKNLVRLENMRYKFPIIEGDDKFLEIAKDKWKKNKGIKNVETYHFKMHGYSVSVFLGKNPVLTINCIKRVGLDIYEMIYIARTEVEDIANMIEEDYNIELGRMETIMQPEWAIPSEFAKVLLDKTNSSQISTPKGVINKSKGRGYDIETRDIRLANKLFNLPYVIDEISREIKSLKVADHSGWFCF